MAPLAPLFPLPMVMCINNHAAFAGGAVIFNSVNVTTDENCTLNFYNNNGNDTGGALYILNSIISIKGNTILTFNNNKANKGGVLIAACSTTKWWLQMPTIVKHVTVLHIVR